ncbi:MAG: hypothetical protein H0T91_05830 [Propionibacteriaceae bacterium]|nr:hypothetical protein [Propionibacteriaceae bacterium]
MERPILPRLGAVCGIPYVALILAGNSLYGSGNETVGLPMELVGMILFIPFLGYLYSVLRRAEGEGGWLSATAFGAGLVEFTVKLVSVIPAFAAHQGGLSPQLAQTLEGMGNFAYIITMLPIGVMMAAVAVVALKTHALPLWLGLLATITAPACLVNGLFFGADFGLAFLLFLLWVALASAVLTWCAGRVTVVETSASISREPAGVR